MGRCSFRQFLCCLPLLALLESSTACRPTPQSTDGGKRPVIAVSIFPVASLVQQLTEGWADVETLLPATASPHGAELTTDQIRVISRADFIVVVGMGLDPWAEQAARAASSDQLAIVRFSDLLDPKDRPANNHLWLDPVLAQKFVDKLALELQKRYPQRASQINDAANKLAIDLSNVGSRYQTQLAEVRQKELITFHNAFDLIAARYGLKIVVRLTDIEAAPGAEITPDKYREAIAAVEKFKLRALYAEPEFPDQAVQALRRQTGAEVFVLDPQGNPAIEGYRTYQEMMRSNLATLVKGQNLPPLPAK